MNFVEKHKALILTSLIAGTLVLALFSLSIKQKSVLMTESYYEVEPQTEEDIKELELLKALEALENTNPKTNQAFNEDEEFKEMMMKFFLGYVDQAKAFDAGRVDKKSAKGQRVHFCKCCGVLAFIARLAHLTNAQVFSRNEVIDNG